MDISYFVSSFLIFIIGYFFPTIKSETFLVVNCKWEDEAELICWKVIPFWKDEITHLVHTSDGWYFVSTIASVVDIFLQFFYMYYLLSINVIPIVFMIIYFLSVSYQH